MARITDGVPEIRPVEVLNTKPADKLGLMLYELTVPPETLGFKAVMVVPRVNILGVL